jgi:hypothetical protein
MAEVFVLLSTRECRLNDSRMNIRHSDRELSSRSFHFAGKIGKSFRGVCASDAIWEVSAHAARVRRKCIAQRKKLDYAMIWYRHSGQSRISLHVPECASHRERLVRSATALWAID